MEDFNEEPESGEVYFKAQDFESVLAGIFSYMDPNQLLGEIVTAIIVLSNEIGMPIPEVLEFLESTYEQSEEEKTSVEDIITFMNEKEDFSIDDILNA